MNKKLAAIVAAALMAAVLVSVVPGFAPGIAAGATTQSAIPDANQNADQAAAINPAADTARRAAAIRRAVAQTIRNGSRAAKIICAQSWPYYAPSCLRDTRRPHDAARLVRLIADDRAAAVRPHR